MLEARMQKATIRPIVIDSTTGEVVSSIKPIRTVPEFIEVATTGYDILFEGETYNLSDPAKLRDFVVENLLFSRDILNEEDCFILLEGEEIQLGNRTLTPKNTMYVPIPVIPYVEGEYTESVRGATSKQDIEEMFKRNPSMFFEYLKIDLGDEYLEEYENELFGGNMETQELDVDLLSEEEREDYLTKDMVNSPHHYIGDQGLEVESVLFNFIPRYKDGYVAHRISSATEYILRAPLKNKIEDLKKAKKNIEQALEYLEQTNTEV